jgi:hypothetical protein
VPKDFVTVEGVTSKAANNLGTIDAKYGAVLRGEVREKTFGTNNLIWME